MKNNPFIPSDYQSSRVAKSRRDNYIARAVFMIRVGTPADQVKVDQKDVERIFSSLESQERCDNILKADIDCDEKKAIEELINNRHKFREAYQEFQKLERIADFHYESIIKKMAHFKLSDLGQEDWFNLCMHSLDILDRLVIRRDKTLLTSDLLFSWLIDSLVSWNEFMKMLECFTRAYQADDEMLKNLGGLYVRKKVLMDYHNQTLCGRMAKEAARDIYRDLMWELRKLLTREINERLIREVSQEVHGLHQQLRCQSDWIRDYQPKGVGRQRLENKPEVMNVVREGKKMEFRNRNELIIWVGDQLGLKYTAAREAIIRYEKFN